VVRLACPTLPAPAPAPAIGPGADFDLDLGAEAEAPPLQPAPEASPPRLVGIITNPHSGKPVVGATIVVTGPALSHSAQSAISDEHGHYAVTDLPPGVYRVTLYYADLEVVRDGVSIGSLDPTIVNLNLDPDPPPGPPDPPLVYGTITEKRTGRPFPGATIIVEGEHGGWTHFGISGDDGHFEITGIPDGSYSYQLYVQGSELVVGTIAFSANAPVRLDLAIDTSMIDLGGM
jgi:hypothetical protein